MNAYGATPHDVRIARQYKASYDGFEAWKSDFSTTLSTDVERKVVVPIKSISLQALG